MKTSTYRHGRIDPVMVAMLDGSIKAQYLYEKMTTDWLSGAAESFLQNCVAIHVSDKLNKSRRTAVDVETSKRKIDGPQRGRPATAIRKRSDIAIFWGQQHATLRAIVEVKIMRRHSSFSALQKDRDKLKDRLRHKSVPIRRGYLLVYSEVVDRHEEKRIDKLNAKFALWAGKLKPSAWSSRVFAPPKNDVRVGGDKYFGWGFAVYAFKKTA